MIGLILLQNLNEGCWVSYKATTGLVDSYCTHVHKMINIKTQLTGTVNVGFALGFERRLMLGFVKQGSHRLGG